MKMKPFKKITPKKKDHLAVELNNTKNYFKLINKEK